MFRFPLESVILALCIAGASRTAAAAMLSVGPTEALRTPGEAARAAHDGDTILIEKGSYFDCAVWSANGLTISSDGPDVVLTDRACEGKAAFVIRGNGITVRGLTFTRIRVADRNGAGIRVEGRDLTVENSRFENNQIGILAGAEDAMSLTVRDCSFADNGGEAAAADILAGRLNLLRVERSQFLGTKGAASISSQALATELTGNRFVVGGTGSAAPYDVPYLVGIANGSLAMRDNIVTLDEGPPRLGVVLADTDAIWPGGAAVAVSGTVLANHTGRPAVLLRDWSGGTTVLGVNQIPAGNTLVSRDGLALHRAKQAARLAISWLRGIAGRLHRLAALILHHLA